MHTFSLSIQDWRLGRSASGLELRLQGGRHRRVGLANDWSLEVVGVVEEIRNRFLFSFAEAMNQQKASRGDRAPQHVRVRERYLVRHAAALVHLSLV